MDCNPNNLADAAKPFQNLSPEHKAAIDTYLLATMAGGSTDPSVLAVQAKEFQKVSPENLRVIAVYLLCQLSGGGTGSGIMGGTAAAPPPTTPTSSFALWILTDSVPQYQLSVWNGTNWVV